MFPYALNGRPTAFWRGDWYVGKGIAHARIRARVRSGGAARRRPPRDHNSRKPVEDSDAVDGGNGGGGGGDGDGGGNNNNNNSQDDALTIEVFNTHTHAPYSSDKSDSYRVHREAQAWALAKLLRAAAQRKGNPLVIAAGDFNTTPLSTAHRIILAHAPVRDVWRVLHPDSSLGSWAGEEAAWRRERERARSRGGGRDTAAGGRDDDDDDDDTAPTAEFNLVENGVTSNSVLNTWRWPKSEQAKLGRGKDGGPPSHAPDPHGKRLDYIFASTAARELDGGDAVGGWVVKDARVALTARHPELRCSLSDHFAVAATLAYHQTSKEGIGAAHGSAGAIDTTSLSLAGHHWPLPPGRGSLFHHHNNSSRRKSTPALLLQGSDDDETNNTINNTIDTVTTTNNNHHQEDDSTTIPEPKGAGAGDIRSPGGGAFLSLQSPTPSTSRLSLPGQLGPTAPAPDYDTQLLSSLPASLSLWGDVPGFDVRDYDHLLAGVRAYVSREADQTRWRTYHFVFWLCLAIVCYVVVWLVPTHSSKLSGGANHAINFILLLLSSLGLVAGVLDGLMALLFFRGNEKRALKEFQWELSNARSLAFSSDAPGFTEDKF